MNENKWSDCICEPSITFPPDIEEPEETPGNMSYYAVDEYGVKWFYCGNRRTKVIEHFSENGKPIDEMIRDSVRFAVKNKK